MPQFPRVIATFRDKSNRSGIIYDPTKKTVIFAEDIKFLEDEIIAIENFLGLPSGKAGKIPIINSEETGFEYVDPIVTIVREGTIVFINLSFSGEGFQVVYTPQTGGKIAVLAYNLYTNQDVLVEIRFEDSGNVIAGLPFRGAIAMNLIGLTPPIGGINEAIGIYSSGAVDVKGWISILEV
jgi:hypothetical protein